MKMNVIELENLSVAYQKTKEAVKNVSFSLPEGKILAIVGESGSGKSTIIRAIMRLLPSGGEITGGRILFCGKDLVQYSKEEMRSIRGREIAMIFQDAGQFLNPKRKIGSQYREAMCAHRKISRKEAHDIAIARLSALKLADPERVLKSYIFQLSGGMRQRVAIAMAMNGSQKLLLADEPTSALDVKTQAQVVEQMLTIRDTFKTAMILVTHNMGVASKMADNIAVMQNGTLIEFGTRDEVIENPKSTYTAHLLSVVPKLREETGV